MSIAVTGWACPAICGHTPSTESMRLEPADSAKARASPGPGGAQLRAVDNGNARASPSASASAHASVRPVVLPPAMTTS
jgi:hypothetical protein